MGYNNPIRGILFSEIKHEDVYGENAPRRTSARELVAMIRKERNQEELMAKLTKASYGSKSKSSMSMKSEDMPIKQQMKVKMMMPDKRMSAMKKKMGK